MTVQESYAKAFNDLQKANRYYRHGVYSKRELQAFQRAYNAAAKEMDKVED